MFSFKIGSRADNGHGTAMLRRYHMALMKRYLIERDIPGIGDMSIVELCGAARASNQAIEKIGK